MITSLLKSIFLMVVIACTTNAYSQTPPNFDLIKLEQTADYKAANPFALQTANYLLYTPLKNENPDRVKSLQFIYKWMTGTPDYSFRLDEASSKLFKGSNELMGVYMAAMVKYSLENKTAAKDPKSVKLNSLVMMLDYCEKKENNVRMSKQLKKLFDAKAKGELEQLL